MLRPGIMLQERYEILELIGSGGMAHVFKARCHKLDRFVAIKALNEEFCSDINFVNKFKIEAQSAAKLNHPNIVHVFDVVDEGDLHYIVMEFIEGITLKNYITKKGKLDEKEAIGIALQVAQGIAAAHEHDIIHRDIKPQNVLISKDGKVKVADFGIARAATTQTQNSTAVGSVHYISPEQARGEFSDARSDIYSLGITIYEMVTGHVPFEGENTVVVALAHLEKPFPNPADYQPILSADFVQIIYKCTEKKPGYRYTHMSQLIQDLRKVLLVLKEPINKNSEFNDSTAQTVMIGSKEMAQIKKGKNPDSKLTKKKKPETEEVNSYLEMLFTGARILVALLIIAVLLFVFSKVSDVFKYKAGTSVDDSNPTTIQHISIDDTSTSESMSLSSKDVYMPNLSNLTEEEAEKLLKENDLYMKITTMQSDTVVEGNVISQKEPAGTVIAKFSDVHVVISEGNAMMQIAELLPDGITVDAATVVLESKNIKVKPLEEYNEQVKIQGIIRFEPEEAKEGDTVTLYVSLGHAPVMVSIPEITGKPEAEAIEMLKQAGFEIGEVTTENHDSIAQGSVIRYNGSGTQLLEGSKVPYVLSAGAEIETTAAVNLRYIGSIAETYNLSNLIGPGSRTTSVEIMIRLKQTVNGKEVLTTKMPPTTITGDVLLPVSYPFILGAPGVDWGQIEVVEVTSGAVLKSYEVRFFAME